MYCIYLDRCRRNAVLYKTWRHGERHTWWGRRRDLSIRKWVITNTQIKCPMACYMVRASKGAATGLRLQPPKSFISDQAGGIKASRGRPNHFFIFLSAYITADRVLRLGANNINKQAVMTRGARKGIRQTD